MENPERAVSYKLTLLACYVGYFVQAVNVNLLPVIFIPLREQFGLSYTQFGTLVLISFVTDVVVSVAFSKAADRYGMRPFLVPALAIGFCGLILFALTPALFPTNVYGGFIISVFMYAFGGGLMELCLSPIVDAIPTDADDSSKALSFLHSFYAWGQVAVVLLTTLLLHLGVPWRAIVLMWSLVPATDAVLFVKAPIARRAEGGAAIPIRRLFRTKIFIIGLIAIAFGGAAETIIAQYASSFMERGMGLPKLFGDILGLCGFALFLGVGRMIYGLIGEKLDIHKMLIGGSVLSLAAYIVIVFTPADAPVVIAIALCGLFVCLLWPGTLAVASKKLPDAGASMFALLAAAGSLGCSIGPWVSGVVTDFAMRGVPSGSALNAEQYGLRAGLLAGALFPLASFIAQYLLKKSAAAKEQMN